MSEPVAKAKADKFDKFMKSVRLVGIIIGLVCIALGIYLLVTTHTHSDQRSHPTPP